jgi:SAM-dependent methyltransferase
VDVVGVDIDPEMLATARRAAPVIPWHLADLATVDLARSFDAIVLAGNVMIFLAPGSERAVVENMARHLYEEGLLVAGFQLVRGRLSLERYDEIAMNAGLALTERWSTWERDAYTNSDGYAVSVHRKVSSVRA